MFVAASRTIGLRLTGFVLAASAVALTAQTARAGCGDYVHISNAASRFSHESQSQPAEHPGPCRGPNCSRSPDRSPLAPAAPAPVPAERAACTFGAVVDPAPTPGAAVTDPTSPFPVGHDGRVERPPRS